MHVEIKLIGGNKYIQIKYVKLYCKNDPSAFVCVFEFFLESLEFFFQTKSSDCRERRLKKDELMYLKHPAFFAVLAQQNSVVRVAADIAP